MSLSNKQILKNSLPIAFTYITLGITFGVLFSQKGGSALETFLIALFCFAGSAQFIAIEFYGPNNSLAILFSTVFLVNIRHSIYSFSFLNMWKGWKRIYLFSALTDENFGVSQFYRQLTPTDSEWVKIFSLNHIYWIIGCVLGNFTPPELIESFQGSEFSLTALFVAIFTSSIKKRMTSNG